MTSDKDSIFNRLGDVADENIAIVDEIIAAIKMLDPSIGEKKKDDMLTPEVSKLVLIANKVLDNNKKLVQAMKKIPRDE